MKPCRGYTTGEKLGKGSYGKVQRVVSASGHIYARKTQDEINLVEYQASKLNHPNVITCHDIQFNCDESRVSMYLSPVGKSLGDLMKNSVLDYEMKLKYIGDIVDGLAHMHYNNILHLDMKPDNIIISNNRAVVIDFGLSIYGKSPLTMINRYSRITSWFRNPMIDYEMKTTGKQIYSRKSDLYSLGIIILLILVNNKFKVYVDGITDEEYIYVKNINNMLRSAMIPDANIWSELIQNLLDGDLDTFDLVNHPALHYHKFAARKMGEIQYPIVNSNQDYVNRLLEEALETIKQYKLEYLPYYVLAYYMKLCLLGPEVPSFEFIACIYYDKFDPENEQVTKYFHNKMTLIESLEDCANFHTLILNGNYEDALSIEPRDIIIPRTTSIKDVLEKFKNG